MRLENHPNPTAILLLCGATFACTPSKLGGGSTTSDIECSPSNVLAALPGQTATTELECVVDGETKTTMATAFEARVAAPFEVELTAMAGRAPGAPFTIAVTFEPTNDGAEAGTVELDYRLGKTSHRAEIRIEGRAGERRPWGREAPAPSCAVGTAPLLARALTESGATIRDISIDATELAESSAQADGLLADGLTLPMIDELRSAPQRAGCLEGRLVGPIAAIGAGQTPIADSIRHAATQLGQPVDDRGVIGEVPGDFDDAVAAICKLTDDECGEPTGRLQGSLREAMTPILWAIADGLAARYERDDTLEGSAHDPSWWQKQGGYGLLFETGEDRYNAAFELDRGYLTGNRRRLYSAAAAIAHAVESAGWSQHTGKSGVRFDLETPAGWIQVRDGATTNYRADDEAILLLVDLGGDDRYLDEIATNENALNAVSVVIDLGGDDTYAIDPDAEPRHRGDDERGAVTLSERFSQGAARNGIAMLFDLGDGSDSYTAARGSQGYAHHGVGVLFDAGGDDVYSVEAAGQGAGQFGIAIAMDLGAGNDQRDAFHAAQGFGFVAGLGALIDDGGDDTYRCDTGLADQGGTSLYYAPQLPDGSNTSYCQGAGYGFRADHADLALSGGIGLLRDLGGDDRYEASVFAQGIGYWQGTGVLSDAGGNDRYDALYYAQGAGVHYAHGILVDEGDGADSFGEGLLASGLTLGSGHDFGVGVLISEGGDDRYRIANLGGGGASCNGVGLFVDNGGDDRYRGTTHSTGVSNGATCSAERPTAQSVGVMIDAGGDDSYEYPRTRVSAPNDGDRWGHGVNSRAVEIGAGIDAEGDSGIRAAR